MPAELLVGRQLFGAALRADVPAVSDVPKKEYLRVLRSMQVSARNSQEALHGLSNLLHKDEIIYKIQLAEQPYTAIILVKRLKKKKEKKNNTKSSQPPRKQHKTKQRGQNTEATHKIIRILGRLFCACPLPGLTGC